MEYLFTRLKEASTWAGIVAVVTGVLGYTLPPEQTQMVISAGVSLVGLFLFFKKDAKSPDAKVSPTAIGNGRSLR
jgi:hypothetical protein